MFPLSVTVCISGDSGEKKVLKAVLGVLWVWSVLGVKANDERGTMKFKKSRRSGILKIGLDVE
jgi:hypothetical protein